MDPASAANQIMGAYFKKLSHKEVVRSYNHGVQLTGERRAELGLGLLEETGGMGHGGMGGMGGTMGDELDRYYTDGDGEGGYGEYGDEAIGKDGLGFGMSTTLSEHDVPTAKDEAMPLPGGGGR